MKVLIKGMRHTVRWLAANDKIEDSDADPFYDQLINTWQKLSGAMAQELAGMDSPHDA